MSGQSLSLRARKKIKAETEKADRERKMTLFSKRMDYARDGALFFKNGNLKESAQSYFQYLALLERTKEVKPGMLDPKIFDPKKDIAELLLISGVYWDLAKLHDRVVQKGDEKVRMYLDRYVAFSKGFPFQHISAELIRKFLLNSSPNHRGCFKDAYVRLGGGKCFIATAVEEHCAETTLYSLRSFRDETLMRSVLGRAFVSSYYKISPTLSRVLIRTPQPFQKKVAVVLDTIAIWAQTPKYK